MKNKVLYEISLKLQELRTNANLTQVEVANKLNINRNTYANWEIGRVEIPLDKINEIAIFYKINIDYILGLDKCKKITNKNKLNYEILAKNLNNYLKNNKLKIEALAIDANTTVSTIWAYLHNKVKIRTIYLYLICKNNNLSVDKMFER